MNTKVQQYLDAVDQLDDLKGEVLELAYDQLDDMWADLSSDEQSMAYMMWRGSLEEA